MNNTNRIKREKIRTALATAILIAAAAAVFVLVLIGLYKINMIRLPDALERLLGTAETKAPEGADRGDEQRIYASLSGTPETSDEYALEYGVDPASLLEMLRSSAPEYSYYAEAQITRADGDKSQVRLLKLSRDGDKYRAEIYEGGNLAVRIICDGETVRYTDFVTYGKELSRDYPASGDFSLEQQLGLPSLEELLSDGDESDLQVTLLRTEDENLYCVQYTYPDLPQRETVYVSLKYGYIVSAQTFYTDKSVYELTTSVFNNEAVFGDSTFNIGK